MIKEEELKQIVEKLSEFWKNKRKYTTEFIQMLNNKESGHSIADYVDAETCKELELLNKKLMYENNKRSMGDFWIIDQNNNSYTPVNIKTGTSSDGSPNIVSINKLIDRLSKNEIDSYYLLIIKFTESKHVDVFFINLIDYLEFTTFDLGPGQLMLKEKKLYDFLKSGQTKPHLQIKDALDLLIKMQEDELPKLLEHRRKNIDKNKKSINSYDPLKKINQDKIKLSNKPKR